MSLIKHTFLCVSGSRRVRALVFFIGLAGWLAGFSAQAQITTLTWTKNNVSVANVPFTIYTNESAFSTALSSSYKETFDDIDAGDPVLYESRDFPLSVNTNSGFSYRLSSPGGLLYPGPVDDELMGIPGSDVYFATSAQTGTLLFNNFSSNIRAVGGLLYPTDWYGAWINTTIKVTATLLDANSYTTSFNTVGADSFFGLTFTGQGIASLRVENATTTNEWYMTVNDFTVGVPEPSTLASFAVGGVLLLALRRVRKA